MTGTIKGDTFYPDEIGESPIPLTVPFMGSTPGEAIEKMRKRTSDNESRLLAETPVNQVLLRAARENIKQLIVLEKSHRSV